MTEQKHKQRFLYFNVQSKTPYCIPLWSAPQWSHPFHTKEPGDLFPRGERACLCAHTHKCVCNAGQQTVLCLTPSLLQEPCHALLHSQLSWNNCWRWHTQSSWFQKTVNENKQCCKCRWSSYKGELLLLLLWTVGQTEPSHQLFKTEKSKSTVCEYTYVWII